MDAANPRAVIGANEPPEPTPFEAARETLTDLEAEAQNYLDGDEITSQAVADDVGKLLDAIRKARKVADEARADEKRAYDEAANAVQAKWKPLLEMADRVAKVAKAALTPWLMAQEAEKRAREDAARIVAEAAAAEAQRLAAAATGSLADAKARDAAIENAEAAAADLARAAKAKASAKGGARAVSLRLSYTAEVTDARAYLNHVARTRPDDLTAWLGEHAQSAVRMGARSLPGVEIKEVRVAV